MKIKELEKKNLVILGIGREGLDSFYFLRKLFPKKVIAIADEKDVSELDINTEKSLGKDSYIKYYGGKNYLKSLKNFDIVVKSPGIQFGKIKKYLKKGVILTSQTELFFDNCPAKIIGITGTKGKSTTASLIYAILKKNGFSAYLLGNIENPSLSHLLKIKKTDVIVYELSSHQLQFLRTSPHIAVFLNIYPEHLDYYKNFNEYFKAKENIALYQSKSDYFIFNPKFREIKNLARKAKSKKISIEPKKYSKLFGQNPELAQITHEDNLTAAIEAGKIFKLTEQRIIRGIKSFKKLPHRLELVGEFKKIKFYDDSIATIPEAAIFAMNSLGESVETMILGGLDRGIDFKKISKEISRNKNIKNLILFPASGNKIWQGINKKEKSRLNKYSVKDMESAVKTAFAKTTPGRICLLSPASPSFGLFKDYKDRGEQFKKYVILYGKQGKK
ncbi:MAG: UDP-N-acetylmuramoyl-L-alanine--D-glutamate ligase [Candidatus Pacebacteria bacterium]|nr:UDP-N-acetylmuramoyl-L-alanine--D-glutamate ligase [Candidatus Paceibacterota bacterium]